MLARDSLFAAVGGRLGDVCGHGLERLMRNVQLTIAAGAAQ